MKKKEKSAVFIGKRKKAIARATVKKGNGRIRINNTPLDNIEPRYKKMRIKEAVILAGDAMKEIDININVRGGGVWGQADAARTALANALVKRVGESLRKVYMDYDKSLLVSDPRRTEPHKPSRSSAGPRRSKQQSKR